MKKILYIDMDNVLVDFASAFKHLPDEVLKAYDNNRDDIDGIFSLMAPMPGAIEAFRTLSEKYDTYSSLPPLGIIHLHGATSSVGLKSIWESTPTNG